MKRMMTALFASVFFACLMIGTSFADRTPAEKSKRYIGAMKVIRCQEYVTLREEPYKWSRALAKVPLGAIVYNCSSIKEKKSFVYAEYDGISGYILVKYLEPAPEYEPAVTSAVSGKMTAEEVAGSGEVVLDWKDFNMSVIAAHEWVQEGQTKKEVLRIGCFIDNEPLWGYTETLEVFNEYTMLRAFIGGTEDDPMVMVFDGGYGLSMLDLLSGKEKWTLTIGNCPLGDGAAIAVNGESGTIYIAGTDGPELVSISGSGRMLWSVENKSGLRDPIEITTDEDMIYVKYRNGRVSGYTLAQYDNTGRLIELQEIE